MPQAVNPDIRNTHAVAQALILAAEEWRDEQNKRKKQQSALSKAPQTEDELWDATYNLTGIKVSRHKVCHKHDAPFTAFADAYFARTSMAIWKASRGFGGKTLLLALLGHMEAITLGAEITILGGSGQQSERVHKAQEQFWTYPKSPVGLLAREPTLYETILKNGGHTTALMASTRSARGPHPQRLRLDEIDEMDLLVLDASLGQTMSARGITAQTVMSSTHQYPDGTMTEMYRRAAEHNWRTYEWCYRENLHTPSNPNGFIDPGEIDRKRSEITMAMWDAEYEGQEPSPESRAIITQAVEDMFDPALGEAPGNLNEEYIFEEPLRTAEYVTGADWAKDRDYTIIVTARVDCTPWRVVAYSREGRKPWPQMVDRFNSRVTMYPGKAAHDATGLGDVVDDLLTVDAEGLQLRGRVRSDMLSEYVKAIESHDIRAPRIEFMYAEHKYATLNDLYGTGHLPDNLCAGAMAVYAHKHGVASKAGAFFA